MKKIKYIRVYSDIHLDFDVSKAGKKFIPDVDLWFPKPFSTDPETLIIIAGDLWHARKPFDFNGYNWIKELAKRFLGVIIVLGNHDFWGGKISKEYQYYEDQIEKNGLKNVFLLQNNIIKLNDVKIVGGTLWTNYDRADTSCMNNSEHYMNDFKHIKSESLLGKLKPEIILEEHKKTYKFIRDYAMKDYPEQKLWVVTHHSPSFRSLYKNDNELDGKTQEDCFYASNSEYLFNDNIDVWVHGHIHTGNYYQINNTVVLSNPRGYHGENKLFNENLLFNTNGEILRK